MAKQLNIEDLKGLVPQLNNAAVMADGAGKVVINCIVDMMERDDFDSYGGKGMQDDIPVDKYRITSLLNELVGQVHVFNDIENYVNGMNDAVKNLIK